MNNDKELRELDAWIAEHVMEWKRVVALCSVGTGTFWVHKSDGVFVQEGNQQNRVCYFRPTNDPAAAMTVFERCVDASPERKLEVMRDGDDWLIQYKDDGIYETSQESTLPLTICGIAKQLFSK